MFSRDCDWNPAEARTTGRHEPEIAVAIGVRVDLSGRQRYRRFTEGRALDYGASSGNKRLPARRRKRRSAYVRITTKAESVQGGYSTDSVSSPMCLKGKAPLPNNVVRRIFRSNVYQG